VKTKPGVSVIVLNWNGKHFLDKCLSSLLNQNYPNYDVLLVDNGSIDGSVGFVEEKFGKNAKLRILALNENHGFSKGNNIGIKCAQSDYVIILNNDTEARKNFITELVNIAESDNQIGSVGCKILLYSGKTWFSQKFMNGGFIVPFFFQTLTKSLVFHVGAGSEGFTPERKVKSYRNMLFTYFKNYEVNNLLLRLPIVMFILLPLWHLGWILHRLASNLRDFERKRGLEYFLSIMRAYMQFLFKLKIFMIKRYRVQRLRKVSDKQIFLNTSLKCLI